MLRAPRQSGKTSTLLALADRLNGGGEYRCLYMNVEAGQAMREDVGGAVATVLSEMASRASEVLHDDSVNEVWSGIPDQTGPGSIFAEVLVRWSAADSRPLVLLIDEIDALIGDSLVSVLPQRRTGHAGRGWGVWTIPASRMKTGREWRVPQCGRALEILASARKLGDWKGPVVFVNERGRPLAGKRLNDLLRKHGIA